MSPIGDLVLFTVVSCHQASGLPAGFEKHKEIKIPISGLYRVKFIGWATAAGSMFARIYKNGVAYGTSRSLSVSKIIYIEDLSFSKDDLCQLYLMGTGAEYAMSESFQLSYPSSFTPDIQQEV